MIEEMNIYAEERRKNTYQPTCVQLLELAKVRAMLEKFNDLRVRIVKSPYLDYMGKVGKCIKVEASNNGIVYTIEFRNQGYLTTHRLTNENGELEFSEYRCKMATLSETKDEGKKSKEDYQYSFQDAFRWLLEGKTIKFVNNGRRFKLINNEIIELIKLDGFTSDSILHDKFYVMENEE